MMALENLAEARMDSKVEIRKKSPSLPAKVRMGFVIEKDGFKVSVNRIYGSEDWLKFASFCHLKVVLYL